MAVFFVLSTAWATNHILRMDEVGAGMDGEPTVQYIVISTADDSQKDWGRQGNEVESRAMLVFFDAAGNETGVFKFPNDPPNGRRTVLIATAAFTNRTGLRADFIMGPMLNPGSGKVCFRGNPANPNRFSVNLCLSYGSFPPGLTEGAGPPAPTLPLIGEPTALVRFQNFTFGDSSSRNADFRLDTPHPTNTAGQTVSFLVPGPEVSVFPSMLDFGGQPVGRRSAQRTLIIQSAGSINSLRVTDVVLTALSNEFRIVSDTGETTLLPGRSRIIQLDCAPIETGLRTASIQITCDDTNESSITIPLIGRGVDLNPCGAPDLAAASPMDSCSDAMLIGPGTSYFGSTETATSDGTNSCVSPVAPAPFDVWYRYVAASNGLLQVTLDRAGVDIRAISAHSSCPGGITNQLACVNIDQGGGGGVGGPALLNIQVTSRQEILFRIASRTNTAASFRLTLRGPAAFNFDRDNNGVDDRCEMDWGDAPDSYATSAALDGARHKRSELSLGRRWDHDANGQPSATATGDNLDGPPNDDDGVTFASPLVPGGSSVIQVMASANGFLNAWIDFGADGSWAQPGDQILTNEVAAAGVRAFTIRVPASAVPTNLSFARFRITSAALSSVAGFKGLAEDGEVEDYAIELGTDFDGVAGIGIRISEVMAGFNGDSAVQFVELEAAPNARGWGPQGDEAAGRAMLLFFDAAGRQAGRFVFPSNAPPGGTHIMVATRAFADATGLQPDFIMPKEVMAVAGKVSFCANPDNAHFAANIGLSYGGNAYFGATDGAGTPNTNALSILRAMSLTRTEQVDFGYNRNSAFQLRAPSPMNSLGQTAALTEAPLVKQGETLFSRETFNGNGRTCGSCHVPGREQFGLTPTMVASLPIDDPLFVFEHDVNIVQLAARSQPSDLRGRISGASGEGTVLAGSGDTYLVVGGRALSGLIRDTNGNSGQLVAFTLGDLGGPTGNGSDRGLEDHDMLRHGRGLILENIDGFRKREVFRASPHLLNVAFTAPYGLSGDFSNLRDFSDTAVAQHFPRSLARVSGVDFRNPTAEELAALEAFMNSIVHPRDGNFDLDRFATTEAQKRGRQLFFNNESKCFRCHSGPLLNEISGALPSATDGNVDTGVANLITNILSEFVLPTEPAGFPAGQSTRKFNIPSLIGIRLTAPFFHEGSARTLRETVDFYDGPEFIGSPSGVEVGSMPAANNTAKIDDLVAFLESLVELPIQFPRTADFGVTCAGSSPGPLFVTITNAGTNVVHLQRSGIVGTNATNFVVVADSGTTNLEPAATRTIVLQFVSATQGLRQASFEFEANDPELGAFSFGIALRGAIQDNIVSSTPAEMRFGTLGIDSQATERRALTITNNGTSPLVIQRMAIVGADATNFSLSRVLTNIAPRGTGVIDVIYGPRSRGQKFASVRIESLACQGGIIDLPISGVATSDVHHFTFSAIPSRQPVRADIPVSIRAHDRNEELISAFSGLVEISGVAGTSGPPAVMITEVDAGSTDRIEISNLSGQTVNLSGWRVVIYDPLPTLAATVVIPSGSVASRASFFVTEGGSNPGTFPNFFAGTNLAWINRSAAIGVMLLNASGQVIDFFTTGDSLSVTNPSAVTDRQWHGPGVAAVADDGAFSFQRIGGTDRNNETDWVMAAPNVGQVNPGLIVPASGAFGSLAVAPSMVFFENGVWNGELAVLEERTGVVLSAHDGRGHSGSSGAFDVIGTAPSIAGLGDRVIDEDTLLTMPFSVSDLETPLERLALSVASSNPDIFGSNSVVLTGTGPERTLRATPRTNAFGTATLTVTVADGALNAGSSFNVTVNPINDPPVLLSSRNLLSENFDQTIQGGLPGGWAPIQLSGLFNQFRVLFGMADTPPGAMFISNIVNASDNAVQTPTFFPTSALAQVSFRHSFNTHASDGGSLEISIANSNFVNVISAGATFVTGGYNAGTSWRGDSGGFMTTIVTLPDTVRNRSIRLRWRFTTDASIGGVGWFVDTVSVREIGSGTFGPITMPEDTLSPALIVQLVDPETPAHELQLGVQSPSPNLLPATNVTISGTGSVRTVEFRPATNAFGNGTLSLNVSDGSLSATQVVNVVVTPVNDAPIMTPISDRVVYVGESITIPLSAVEVDIPTNFFNFQFVPGTLPPGGFFDAVAGVFRWTPGNASRGTNTISFFVRDVGNPPMSSTQTFRVVVESAPLVVTNLVDFGLFCSTQGLPASTTLALTNSGTNALSVAVSLSGTNASDFTTELGDLDIPAGARVTLPMRFLPTALGRRDASIELNARVTSDNRTFRQVVALRGTMVDNIAFVSPSQIEFGTVAIQSLSSAAPLIVISNSGATPLVVSSVRLTGTNASEFQLQNPVPTNIPPLGTHQVRVDFAPFRRGPKSAAAEFAVQSCNGTNLVVPLSGSATSVVTAFAWNNIPSPQAIAQPFPATIRALDINGDVVDDFSGPLSIRTANIVRLLSFTRHADTGLNSDFNRSLDVIMSQFTEFTHLTTTTTNAAALEVLLADKHVFLIPEQDLAGTQLLGVGAIWAPVLSNFVTRGGTVIVCSRTQNEDLLLRETGLMQPTRTGQGAGIALQTQGTHALLEGIPTAFLSPSVGIFNSPNGTTLISSGNAAVAIAREIGLGRVLLIGTDFSGINTPLDRLLVNAVRQATLPFGPSPVMFVGEGAMHSGVWSGTLTISNEIGSLSLIASDNAGRSGISLAFDVRGLPPMLVAPSEVTIDEDNSTDVVVSVSDNEVPAERLILTTASSNSTLLPATNITILGTGPARLVRMVPLPDRFGSSIITFTLRDGAVATNFFLTLRVRGVNDPPFVRAGTAIFSENFDNTPLSLVPTNWAAVNLVGTSRWSTVSADFHSPSNAAFVTNVALTTDTQLLTPLVVLSNSPRLSFRHRFGFGSGDSGSLEMAITPNLTLFSNVVSFGATFATGGYNVGNTWQGTNGGFTLSELVLPPTVQTQQIRFRWRFNANNSSAGLGWFVDTVVMQSMTTSNHLGTLHIDEDVASTPIPFQINDDETGPDDLAITITSSNQTLIPITNVLFTGVGTNRALQLRSATNQFGATTLRMTFSDGLITVTRLLDVNVRPIDDPPVIEPLTNQSIFVGERLVVPVRASDPDNPSEPFLFSLLNPIPEGASINPTNGVFTWQPAVSLPPVAIRVLVRMAASPSIASTQTFQVSVTSPPLSWITPSDFGSVCFPQTLNSVLRLPFSNEGSADIILEDVRIVGTNAGEFVLQAFASPFVVPVQGTNDLVVVLNTASMGRKDAVLEFTGVVQGRRFAGAVILRALLLDNIAVPSAPSLDFGLSSIGTNSLPPQTLRITNFGSLPLRIVGVSLFGPDFRIVSDSGETNLAPLASRAVQIAFDPDTRGTKSGTLRVDSLACAGSLLEVPISGIATSAVTHFTWGDLGSSRAINTFFPVQITARDTNGDVVTDYDGPFHIAAQTRGRSGGGPITVLSYIAFADVNPNGEYERTMSVLRASIPDLAETTTSTTSALALESDLAGKDVFLIVEQEQETGQMSALGNAWSAVLTRFVTNGGTVIVCSHTANEHFALLTSGLLILNKSGSTFSGAVTAAFEHHPLLNDTVFPSDPLPIARFTLGNGRPLLVSSPGNEIVATMREIGLGRVVLLGTDFSASAPSFEGVLVNIVRAARSQSVLLTTSGARANGVWTGSVLVGTEAKSLHLVAHDGSGHSGISAPVDITGLAPGIAAPATFAMDEDSAATFDVTLSDLEALPDQLRLTVVSTNAAIFSESAITMIGSGAIRTIRLEPHTNQFGLTALNVIVNDGVLSVPRQVLVNVRPVDDSPALSFANTSLNENFDFVTRPNLPAGWFQTNFVGVNTWQTVNTTFDTAPNSLFISNPSTAVDSAVVSPPVRIASSSVRLGFRHSFNTQPCCDGGWLEISINSGPFNNIVNAGGAFLTGGYTSGSMWRGFSSGFMSTTSTLPAAAVGQLVRFRWRFATDSSTPALGWFIDSIALQDVSGTNQPDAIVTDEDMLSSPLFVQVEDPDTPADMLQLSALSTNPDLIPDANIFIGGAGGLRSLQVLPNLDQFGTATVIITLSDGTTSVSQPVEVTVRPINDPPVILPIGDRHVFAGEALSIPISAIDHDPPHSLTLSLIGAPPGAVFTNGVFNWQPLPAQIRSWTVEVSARDLGTPPQTATQTFRIIVDPPPLALPASFDFGFVCPEQTNNSSVTQVVQNTGSDTITVLDMRITGGNASEFAILDPPLPFSIPAGGSRAITMALRPSALGTKSATIEFTATVAASGRMFVATVLVTASLNDAIAAVSPPVINFGARPLGVTSPAQSIVLSNAGTTAMTVLGVSVLTSDPSEFLITADTGPATLPPRSSRRIDVAFRPSRRGARTAQVQIDSRACVNSNITVSLQGTGTSPVASFTFDPISSPQSLNTPFPVRVAARDLNGDVVDDFAGPLTIEPISNESTRVLTFVGSADTTPAGEYQSTLAAIRSHYTNFTESSISNASLLQLESALANRDVFLIVEQEYASTVDALSRSWAPAIGDFVYRGGTVIACSHFADEHLFLVNSGLLDVTKLASHNSGTLVRVSEHPVVQDVAATFSAGFLSTYSVQSGAPVVMMSGGDAVAVVRDIGFGRAVLIGSDFFERGSDLDRLIANAVRLARTTVPASAIIASGAIQSGVWTGTVTVTNQSRGLQLRARDNSGHAGISAAFDVLGQSPLLLGVADVTIDEDRSVALPFVVSDAETSADALVLTAISSDLAILPRDNLVVSGSGSSRTLRLTPATNMFGSVNVTLRLFDGASTTVTNFLLQVRPINDVPFILPPGIAFAENFDSVSGTALPAEWTGLSPSGQPWRVTNSLADSPPNALHVGAVTVPTDSTAETPPIAIRLPSPQLSFRHRFLTAACCENALLEVAVGNDGFVSVPAAFGTYLTGAPNAGGTWSGDSGGFITTTVTFPLSFSDQTIRFRWRYVSTISGGQPGWWVDNITVRDAAPRSAFDPIQVIEDSGNPQVNFAIGDAELPPHSLAVTATSTNAALISSLQVTGSGPMRTLNIQPFPDAFGSDFITLRISDGELSATYNLPLTIIPTNDTPVFTNTFNRFVHQGEQIGFYVRAHDPDPQDQLSYRLQVPVTGANIDTNSGFFTWTVPVSSQTNFSFIVRVFDNGSPQRTSSAVFQLTAFPGIRLSQMVSTPQGMRLAWNVVAGRTYRVQFTDDLNANWLDLAGDIVAAGGSVAIFTPATNAQRFYRITALPSP